MSDENKTIDDIIEEISKKIDKELLIEIADHTTADLTNLYPTLDDLHKNCKNLYKDCNGCPFYKVRMHIGRCYAADYYEENKDE